MLVYRSLRFGFQRISEYTSPSRAASVASAGLSCRRGRFVAAKDRFYEYRVARRDRGFAVASVSSSRSPHHSCAHFDEKRSLIAARVIHPFSTTCIYGRESRCNVHRRTCVFCGNRRGSTRHGRIEVSGDVHRRALVRNRLVCNKNLRAPTRVCSREFAARRRDMMV